ncbi:MAG: hypothetical protein WC322_01450 [Candidatus Paceibacterota bacterium]
MAPCEIWWLIDARTPEKMYGSLRESEVAEIYEQTYGPVDDGDI